MNPRTKAPVSRGFRRTSLIALTGLAALGVACDDGDDGHAHDLDAAAGGAGGTSSTAGKGGASAGTGGTSPDAGAGGSTGGASVGGAGGATDAGAGGAPVLNQKVAIIRFTATGQLDTTFGTNGVTKLDRNPIGTAQSWDVKKNAANELFVFGGETATGTRSDTDRYIAKLSVNGALDTTFGETVMMAKTGFQTINIGNLNDSVRGGLVDTDGKIVGAGYSPLPTGVGSMTANSIVVARLNTDGSFDNTFGVSGILNRNPFQKTYPMPWGVAEAYGITRQSTGSYVTCGYGTSTSGQVNVVSIRVTSSGVLDSTWGNNGAFERDWNDNQTATGTNDRCRALAALPDNRVLLGGSYEEPAMKVNPMLLVLTANGALDTTWGTGGYKLLTGSVAARTDEAFFSVVVSPTSAWAAAVGYSAGGTGLNDDGRILLLPLGAGTEVAKEVPISATLNDRFFAAEFDGTNKLYAAGFVAESATDTAFMVARFDTTGTLDTTFGTGGFAKVNVAVDKGTAETARAIVLQSDGKIVLVGNLQE